ncbi:MAG: hypothetical protein AAGI14_07040 [Pseudomonadota bacterium]
MPRQTIALLIAIYAIAFAFGAMAAIRWPSIMMMLAFTIEAEAMQAVPDVNWRELGIAYGAPYFLAALCLYASAMMVSQRRRGGVLWYAMGCVSGFPCAFLVDFEAGWWRDPGVWEGAAIGGAAGAVLLGIAVWMLRGRSEKQEPMSESEIAAETPQVSDSIPVTPAPERKQKPKIRRRVPPAIAQQRARWAREGRAMRVREQRRSKHL